MTKRQANTTNTATVEQTEQEDTALLAQVQAGQSTTEEFSWDSVDSEEFKGGDGAGTFKLPMALFLNTEKIPNHGLFVKQSDMELAGWHGFEPNHQHQFRGAKEPTSGILFHGFKDGAKDYSGEYPVPHLQILNVSPIYIEVNPKLDNTGNLIPVYNPFNGNLLTRPNGEPIKRGDIIGIYDLNNGSPLYEGLKTQQAVSLRTFYVLYFLDHENKQMHDLPIVLSTKGVTATAFAKSYDSWKASFNLAYGAASGKGADFSRNQKFYACGVYAPTLGTTWAGEGNNQSLVTVPVDFLKPTVDNIRSLFLFNMVKSVPALVDGTAGFVERFFEENSEYHSLMPGVETAALPEGIDSDTGENVIDVAATATSVLNPSLMDVDF